MEKQVAIRRIRIAVSVFFALVTVALCVLWMQSYSWVNQLQCKLSRTKALVVMTVGGEFLAAIMDTPDPVESSFYTAKLKIGEAEQYQQPRWRFAPPEEIKSPIWFLIATCGVVAAAPWVRWKFSLRTLLVAMTLVAVVLGLAVWAGR